MTTETKQHAALLLLALLPAISGCGADDDGAAAWAGSVTDSAGIEVVLNPEQGLWSAEEAWSVREVLSIGAMEGDDAEQFGRIGGVEAGPDGTVYVLDGQAREVRVFDSTGDHLRTVGEPGQGPGQLGQALGGVFLVGDDLLVPDLANQRVSRFSRDGEHLGSFRLDFTTGVPVRWDGPVDGRLLAQKRVIPMPGAPEGPAEATGDPVVALTAEGSTADTLVLLPRGESLDVSGGNASFNFFAPEPIWDAGPDGRIVSGMNSEVRIEVRDPDGRLARVIVLPRDPRPVTERDQEQILEAVRELMREQGAPPQVAAMMLDNATFAESYPLFASLLAGPDGSVWAQRIRTGDEIAGPEGTFDPEDLGSPVWDVFDATGRYLGTVTFPARFQPLRVDGERIYGIGRDELGVQRLQAFEVVRPGS